MTPRVRRTETTNGALNAGSEVLASVRDQTLEHLAGEPITIACRDGTNQIVHVGKLCIDQLVALSRFGVKLWKVVGSSGLEPVLTEMTKQNSEDPERDKAAMDAALTKVSGEAVLDALLDTLTEDQIGALVGVIVDMPSNWCRENVGLPDMLRIGEAVMAHNEWSTLVGFFDRAVRRHRPSAPASINP